MSEQRDDIGDSPVSGRGSSASGWPSSTGGPSSGGRVRVILRRTGLVLLGVVLYTICMNMYSGYPAVGSPWINRAAILAIVVFAAVVFIRDERRHSRGDAADPAAAAESDGGTDARGDVG